MFDPAYFVSRNCLGFLPIGQSPQGRRTCQELIKAASVVRWTVSCDDFKQTILICSRSIGLTGKNQLICLHNTIDKRSVSLGDGWDFDTEKDSTK